MESLRFKRGLPVQIQVVFMGQSVVAYYDLEHRVPGHKPVVLGSGNNADQVPDVFGVPVPSDGLNGNVIRCVYNLDSVMGGGNYELSLVSVQNGKPTDTKICSHTTIDPGILLGFQVRLEEIS